MNVDDLSEQIQHLAISEKKGSRNSSRNDNSETAELATFGTYNIYDNLELEETSECQEEFNASTTKIVTINKMSKSGDKKKRSFTGEMDTVHQQLHELQERLAQLVEGETKTATSNPGE
ncbi:hypothetical protein K3495_g13273, partial [Podosphaera aphanis]